MRRGKALGAWALAAGLGYGGAAQAAIVFQEDFEAYADTAAMNVNWDDAGVAGAASLGPAPFGHPGQFGNHAGGAVAQHNITSIIPTDAQPVRVEFDYFDYATGPGDRYSLGIRSGAAIFEFAEYNALDADTSVTGNATTVQGYGFRTVFVGGPGDVGGWVPVSTTKVTGWHHFVAEIGETYLTVTLDSTDDSVVNPAFSVTVPLTNNVGKALDNVRFGGPSNVSSTNSPGAGWDNISVEVVPEPATMGLLGLGALLLRVRRRAAA